MGFDFSLPEFGEESGSWDDPDNYTLDAGDTVFDNVNVGTVDDLDSWWSPDFGDDDDWLDGALSAAGDVAGSIWDWSNTSAGVSVLGGALSGGLQLWGEDRRQDERMDLLDKRMAPMNQHNKSVNEPTKLNLRKWKK